MRYSAKKANSCAKLQCHASCQPNPPSCSLDVCLRISRQLVKHVLLKILTRIKDFADQTPQISRCSSDDARKPGISRSPLKTKRHAASTATRLQEPKGISLWNQRAMVGTEKQDDTGRHPQTPRALAHPRGILSTVAIIYSPSYIVLSCFSVRCCCVRLHMSATRLKKCY